MSAPLLLIPISGVAQSDLTDPRSLQSPAVTSGGYTSASIMRDSGLSQPLELLNDFYPSIEVTYADHDNVRRRSDFDEADTKWTIRPGLAYRSEIGRHKFYLAYNGEFTVHDELDQEDAESHNLDGKIGLDVSRRWDVEVYGRVGESYEQRGVSGGRTFGGFRDFGVDSGPEEYDFYGYGADLIYGRKLDSLQVVLGYDYSNSSYDSQDLSVGFENGARDREAESLHLDVNWRFAPKTSVFGRIQETETDYDDNTTDLDSEETSYLIGLRFKPTARFSGVAGIGRTEKDFSNPAREDYEGSSYYANLSYRMRPFSTVTLHASNFVEEPADVNADFYESANLGVSWRHAFSTRLGFDVYAKWIDDEYNSGREDEYFNWGVGLDYVFRSWLTAGLYYGEIERESNLDTINYDDRFFGIRLRSDLRNLLGGGADEDSFIEPDIFEYPRRTQNTQKTQKSQ